MSKIIVVSDSHGDFTILNQILLKEQDATYFFHLGDSELPQYMLNNFLCVKGNCDYSSTFPLKRDITIDNLKIHMEHSNKIPFYDFENYVKKQNCDIFLFGHTHKKLHQKKGNCEVFNPGSTSFPRDGSFGSYLIIKILNNKIDYEFVTLS